MRYSSPLCTIWAWQREIRLSGSIRSLSFWRPRLKGVREISTSRSFPNVSLMIKRGSMLAM